MQYEGCYAGELLIGQLGRHFERQVNQLALLKTAWPERHDSSDSTAIALPITGMCDLSRAICRLCRPSPP